MIIVTAESENNVGAVDALVHRPSLSRFLRPLLLDVGATDGDDGDVTDGP